MSSTIPFHVITPSSKEDDSIIPTPGEPYNVLNQDDTDLLAGGERVEQGKDLPAPLAPSKVPLVSPTSPPGPSKVPLRDQLKGLACILTASVGASIHGALVKSLTIIPTGYMMGIIGVFSVLFYSTVILHQNTPLGRQPLPGYFALRILLGCGAYVCKTWSFQFLPLGDASAIVFTSPIFAGKHPIRTRYLGHVTGYQPIRDQYFQYQMFRNHQAKSEQKKEASQV